MTANFCEINETKHSRVDFKNLKGYEADHPQNLLSPFLNTSPKCICNYQ